MDERIKNFWKINKDFVWALLWTVIISVIVYFVLKLSKVNNNLIIQISPIIALVFITLFYAVQTKRLVQEEQKTFKYEKDKEIADHGVKRIKGFLQPIDRYLVVFTSDLSSLQNNLNTPIITKTWSALNDARAIYSEVNKMFIERYFLADILTNDRWHIIYKNTIKSWPTFENQEEQYVKSWLKKVIHETLLFRLFILSEILDISKRVQKVYGYYSENIKEARQILDKTWEEANKID